MTDIKHTPGPWSFDENQHLAAGNRSYGILTLAPAFNSDNEDWPYHPRVACVQVGHGSAPKEIAKANARLIAAAPELLEAVLRVLSSQHFSIDYERNRTPEASDIRALLEAAASKAGA